MHELGLATEIASIVEDALAKDGAKGKVKSINLKIGEMRQVVPDALNFCFENVAKDTRLAGAELKITHIPVGGVCKKCGADAEFSEPPFVCRACGSTEMKLNKGFELDVTSFEVDDS